MHWLFFSFSLHPSIYPSFSAILYLSFRLPFSHFSIPFFLLSYSISLYTYLSQSSWPKLLTSESSWIFCFSFDGDVFYFCLSQLFRLFHLCLSLATELKNTLLRPFLLRAFSNVSLLSVSPFSYHFLQASRISTPHCQSLSRSQAQVSQRIQRIRLSYYLLFFFLFSSQVQSKADKGVFLPKD